MVGCWGVLRSVILDGNMKNKLPLVDVYKRQTWCRVVGKRLAQLLNNPGTARMFRHVPMENALPIMGYHEEAIEHSEGERRHGEEIHRGNGLAMIAQKRRPSFGRLRTPRSFPHPAQHRSLRQVEAQHLQFTMNARSTPGRVLGNHSKDESSQLLADALPARADSMP